MRRALLLIPLLLLGCESPSPKLAGTGMDMFAPVKVRLHPLSRVVLPSTQPATAPAAGLSPAIEARVELADQFNDPGKGIGDITLQLFEAVGTGTAARKGQLLATWNASINDPAPNRDHWDRTTRTYLFRFPLPNGSLRDRYILSATVSLPNQATLSDEAVIQAR